MSLVVRIKSLVGCEKCVQKLSRNHFCRIYLSREVSATLCYTCMPKYLKIIFHYSGSEMEYKCDSNNSRGSGESLFETLDLIKEYFNEISGWWVDGAGENAEHKNKNKSWDGVDTGQWRHATPERIVDTRGAPHTQLLPPYSVSAGKILPYYSIWLNIVRFEILLK